MDHKLIGHTFGALLVGGLCSAVLYGVVCLQVLTYLTRFFKEDKQYVVVLVVTLWSIETAYIFLVGNYIYRCLIVQYGNPLALTIVTKADGTMTGLLATIIFIVHCFLTWRIWILSKSNMWLTCIIGLLALVHVALEITVVVSSVQYAHYDQLMVWYASALASGAILDIIIAGSVTYFLKRHQKGTKRIDNMINIIVAYAIGSGALTSVADIVIIAFFVSWPMKTSFLFLAIYICIPHLYAISLLTTLNARISLRKMSLDSVHFGSRHNAVSFLRSTGGLQFATDSVFYGTQGGTEDDNETRSTRNGKHPQI